MDEEAVQGGEQREKEQEDGGKLGIVDAIHRQREEKKKEIKPRKPVKILRVEDFVNPETGFRLLYKEMRKKNERLCKLAEVQPEKALQDYMSTVKEWAFNVAPKYEFDYFVDRMQTLARKKELADEMSNLRRYHKGELTYDRKNKEYISKHEMTARVTILEEKGNLAPKSNLVNMEAVVPVRDENYDPAKDADRGLETFISPELLEEYSIKKKVKLNSSPENGSPNGKVKMDIESPQY